MRGVRRHDCSWRVSAGIRRRHGHRFRPHLHHHRISLSWGARWEDWEQLPSSRMVRYFFPGRIDPCHAQWGETLSTTPTGMLSGAPCKSSTIRVAIRIVPRPIRKEDRRSMGLKPAFLNPSRRVGYELLLFARDRCGNGCARSTDEPRRRAMDRPLRTCGGVRAGCDRHEASQANQQSEFCRWERHPADSQPPSHRVRPRPMMKTPFADARGIMGVRHHVAGSY